MNEKFLSYIVNLSTNAIFLYLQLIKVKYNKSLNKGLKVIVSIYKEKVE